MSPDRQRLLALLAAVAAGLLALGCKLAFIHAHGSDLPYMDEWDALGLKILVPLHDGTLRLADFLAGLAAALFLALVWRDRKKDAEQRP